MGNSEFPAFGIVAIGRNEGERLRRCLESVVKCEAPFVYVDSGSDDDSVGLARSMGVTVVELDMTIPFTAARARNAGVERLLELVPGLSYVHFLDGDCEVVDGWFDEALKTIENDESIAVVWGRRTERFPEKTRYNKLTDLEWRFNWPYGETAYCGGDALMRLTAFQRVGGFDATLIAGEEPELCHRLRRNDWRIYRLDADMTVHDADMKRFSQWWRRCARTGYVSAEGAHRLGREKERYAVRPFLSTWFWGLLLPITAFGAAWPTRGLSLTLLAGYFILASRIHRGIRHKGASAADSALYAFFCVLSKFPAMEGQIRYISRVVRRQQGRLIEYK